jgi:hypothetical protein
MACCSYLVALALLGMVLFAYAARVRTTIGADLTRTEQLVSRAIAWDLLERDCAQASAERDAEPHVTWELQSGKLLRRTDGQQALVCEGVEKFRMIPEHDGGWLRAMQVTLDGVTRRLPLRNGPWENPT